MRVVQLLAAASLIVACSGSGNATPSFRAGSRLRLTIDAPGGNRAVWQFATIDKGETVTVAFDAQHPSKLVLPVVAGVDVPKAAPPACGSLRGEPCRRWVKASNGG